MSTDGRARGGVRSLKTIAPKPTRSDDAFGMKVRFAPPTSKTSPIATTGAPRFRGACCAPCGGPASSRVRERKNFQPLYDLTDRVIPEKARRHKVAKQEATKILLLKALDGHGWATTKTLIDTWRLTKRQNLIKTCLGELHEEGAIVPCSLEGRAGWIRPEDLELAGRLERIRPRSDVGVLLSPFDPVLWDRDRVQTLFGFEQVLEIFKPTHQRKYGYYCMPVLAGDKLVARCDLKADRKAGRLDVLATHHEARGSRAAVETALTRYASALRLALTSPV